MTRTFSRISLRSFSVPTGRTLAKVLPVGTEKLRNEIRENVRVILESSFERMNLVTREEFDAQTALLRRTREKLDELEAVVAALEPE